MLLEQACRKRRLQMGRQRLVLVEVLSTATDHPSADEIYDRARRVDPNISIATVYRTLALFERHGLVFSFEFGDRKVRYEDATRGPHDHLIDADSGEIINFKDDRLEKLLRKLAHERGYELRDYRLDMLCMRQQPVRWTKTLARRVLRGDQFAERDRPERKSS